MSKMLLLTAKLFNLNVWPSLFCLTGTYALFPQKLDSREKATLKDKIIRGEATSLEPAVRSFENTKNYDALADAFRQLLSPHSDGG